MSIAVGAPEIFGSLGIGAVIARAHAGGLAAQRVVHLGAGGLLVPRIGGRRAGEQRAHGGGRHGGLLEPAAEVLCEDEVFHLHLLSLDTRASNLQRCPRYRTASAALLSLNCRV